MQATFSPGGFASLRGPARWTKGLLSFTVVLAALGALSSLAQVELISRAAEGIAEAEATANDARQQVIGALKFLTLIATAVVFLIWFHRAHANLAASRSPKGLFTPGWAVGSFFVPFLNVAWPFMAMRELWNGTMSADATPADAASEPSSAPSLPTSTPAIVGWWWALFLVSNALENASSHLGLRDTPTLPTLELVSWLMVGSNVLEIAAATLAIVLVDRITARQLRAEP